MSYTTWLGSNNSILMSLDENHQRLGVNQVIPSYTLDVNGSTRINSTNTTNNKLLVLHDEDATESLVSGNSFFGLGMGNGCLTYQVPNYNFHRFFNGTVEMLTLGQYYYEGINNNNPQHPLDIIGTTNIQGGLTVSGYASFQYGRLSVRASKVIRGVAR